MTLTYAVVTPARDESANLRRQAAWLAGQTVRPARWVIADNGSERSVARELVREHDWIRVLELPADEAVRRGGTITRAFEAGLAALDVRPDVVIKLDADVSGEPDYFELLLDAFAGDPKLGIASGSCYELERGEWRQRHVTGDHVWGASRAYRWECLQAVLPLEPRMGWDAVDELKAAAAGWRTQTMVELPFRHHRAEGERDGSRRRAWEAAGRICYYLGYKRWYLVLRALHQGRREPAALALLLGYASAAFAREPRCPDEAVRGRVREQQNLRALPLRVREALGRRR